MKRIVVVMVLALIGLTSYGQLYPPIQPYNENGYQISEFKSFTYGTSELSVSFRKELLNLINYGLSITGESKNFKIFPFNDSCIEWIYDPEYTWVEDISLPAGFINSRKVGNKVQFFLDSKSFHGPCLVFHYGSCRVVLAKTICMNLLKVPVVVSPVIKQEFTQQTEPVIKSSLFEKPADFIQPKSINDFPLTTLPKEKEELIAPLIPAVDKKKSPWPWIVGGTAAAALIGTGIYFLTRNPGGPGGADLVDGRVVLFN